MQKLSLEHMEVYQEFIERKFVVKVNFYCPNAVSRDKLEQRSQRFARVIIDQTRKESFVTK